MWLAIKRGSIVVIGLLLQILLTLFIYLTLGEYIQIIQIFYGMASVLIVLAIVKNSKRLSSDLIWIIIIMLFPLVGTLLFIILSKNRNNSKILKNINKNVKDGQKYKIKI